MKKVGKLEKRGRPRGERNAEKLVVQLAGECPDGLAALFAPRMWTLKRISEATGVEVGSLGKILRGRTLPTAGEADGLAKWLGISEASVLDACVRSVLATRAQKGASRPAKEEGDRACDATSPVPTAEET